MSDAYGLFFRRTLFPAWESVVRRRPTLGHLAHLERTQYGSRDELLAMQGWALGHLVAHAYARVPYYRRRFDELCLVPSDVATVADIGKLPLLTREEAQQSFAERRSTAPPFASITKMTSGTTGQPVAFAYDSGSEHWRNAVKLRGYGWAGVRPGDRILHYWGMLDVLYPKALRARLKQGVDRFLRREHYIDCTDRSAHRLANVVQALRQERPDGLVCYTQAGVALARYVIETNARNWSTIPVVCGAEPLLDSDRVLLQQAFGPSVFLTYGSREFMLIATECEAHAGLHISMENLLVEVLVRRGDQVRPAEPGEVGEVVVTDLHNYGMPFIRYVTGDLAVQAAERPCSCGRALPKLASIQGRRNDTLRDAEGAPVSGMFFAVMFSVLADQVRQFQAVQHRDGSLDLKIVPTTAFEPALLESITANCRKTFKGTPIHISLVSQIPPGKNGKLRFVVVES